MKELSPEEVQRSQQATDAVVQQIPRANPEVSANSAKEGKTNPLAQLIACRQATMDAMERMPEKPSKDSILALHRSIALEQDYCMKVIAKVEPLIPGSQASEHFFEAVKSSKDRIGYEQALTNRIFNSEVNVKDPKEMDFLMSMRVGLNYVRNQETTSWLKYQKALESVRKNNESSLDPTWIWLAILCVGYFLLKNWRLIKGKFDEERNHRISEMDKDDSQKSE